MGDELYMAHREAIEAAIGVVCARYHLSPPYAEDFAQAARLHLVECGARVVRQFRGESTLRTYLTVVLTRHCARWWRQVAIDRARSSPVESARRLCGSEATDARVSRADAARHAARIIYALRDALSSLHPADDHLLQLRFQCGLGIGDMAQRLGVTPNAAQLRLRRVLKKLRRKLRAIGLTSQEEGDAVTFVHEQGARLWAERPVSCDG